MSTEREETDLGVRIVRMLTLGVGLAVLGISVFVVVQRFRYPIDAEWMVGAVRDAVERVRDGEKLYVAPGPRFVPFIYGPLYYYVSALVSKVCSVFVACKLVSLASTVIVAWGIVQLTRMFGVPRFWTWIAVLCHVATYPVTLFFFDLERVDTFAVAVVMLGVIALLRSETLAWTAVGGALLGLSFFAKQMNVITLAAAAAGLVVAGQRKRAGVAFGAGALVLAIGFAWLEATTGPWFRFYCLKLPGTHGIEPKLLTTFFIIDVPKVFGLALGTVAIVAPLAWSLIRTRKAPTGATWREIVFATVLAASLAGAYFMRVHRGGWLNVIVFWTPFACVATAVAAARLEERAKGTKVARAVSLVLAGGIAVQFLGAMFDPNDNAPEESDYAEVERLRSLVKKLEEQGEVVVTTRGNMTTPRHAHAAAMYDIIRAGLPAPPELVSDIQRGKYVAILVNHPSEYECDVSPTCRDLVRLIAQYYFVAAQREESQHTGMSGFDARPRWIMRPRKHPLLWLDEKTLFRRSQIEMGIAEMRRRQAAPKTELMPDDDIEDLAAQAPTTSP